MTSIQNEINELIDRVRKNFKEKWLENKYLNKNNVDYLLETFQGEINNIFEKNKDHYIRW